MILNNVRKCLKLFTFPFFSLWRSTFGKLHVSWLRILGAHPNWKCFPLLPLTCPPSCVHCRQVVLFLTQTSFWCHLVLATAFCVYLAFISSTPLLFQQRSPLGWHCQCVVPTCQREKGGGGGGGGLCWVCYGAKAAYHVCHPEEISQNHTYYIDLHECRLCPYQFLPSQIRSDSIYSASFMLHLCCQLWAECKATESSSVLTLLGSGFSGKGWRKGWVHPMCKHILFGALACPVVHSLHTTCISTWVCPNMIHIPSAFIKACCLKQKKKSCSKFFVKKTCWPHYICGETFRESLFWFIFFFPQLKIHFLVLWVQFCYRAIGLEINSFLFDA